MISQLGHTMPRRGNTVHPKACPSLPAIEKGFDFFINLEEPIEKFVTDAHQKFDSGVDTISYLAHKGIDTGAQKLKQFIDEKIEEGRKTINTGIQTGKRVVKGMVERKANEVISTVRFTRDMLELGKSVVTTAERIKDKAVRFVVEHVVGVDVVFESGNVDPYTTYEVVKHTGGDVFVVSMDQYGSIKGWSINAALKLGKYELNSSLSVEQSKWEYTYDGAYTTEDGITYSSGIYMDNNGMDCIKIYPGLQRFLSD